MNPSAPAVVLDTNALLDWLVFRHPACSDWGSALLSGRARWIVTPAVRDEWQHVLARGLRGWALPPDADLEAAWSLAEEVAPRPLTLTVPRCSDTDDQKFVDLAVSGSAKWLVSRDRAVLKLRKRLAALGVGVLTPRAWTGELGLGQSVQQEVR